MEEWNGGMMGKEGNVSLTPSLSPIIHQSSPLLSGEVFPELVRDILSKYAECRFQAKGYSMSPFIKDGDVLTISLLPSSSPGLGDVVAFNHPEGGRFVIHRIVRKRGDSYLVRGENTFEADGHIEKRDILGFVTRVERKGRRVLIGLGPERLLIAFLSRNGLLLPLLHLMWKMIRPFRVLAILLC
jgi:signal peptidase